MKKLSILLVLIVGVFFISGCTLFNKNKPQEQTAQTEENTMVQDPVQDPTTDLLVAPEGALTYIISENSQVAYQVNKEYFGKPVVLVKGQTSDVQGSGWADFANQDFNIEANVNLLSLTTDSAKRDSDILPLFGVGTAKVKLISIEGQVNKDEAFTVPAVLEITINDVSQNVNFDVNGTFTDNGLNISGKGMTSISGFGIKAPFADNVFEVKDDLELSFTINAVNNETMQEITESKNQIMDEDGQ